MSVELKLREIRKGQGRSGPGRLAECRLEKAGRSKWRVGTEFSGEENSPRAALRYRAKEGETRHRR